MLLLFPEEEVSLPWDSRRNHDLFHSLKVKYDKVIFLFGSNWWNFLSWLLFLPLLQLLLLLLLDYFEIVVEIGVSTKSAFFLLKKSLFKML